MSMHLTLGLIFAAVAWAQRPELPACTDSPVFSVLPMAAEDFLAFRPLGWISPLQHVFPAKHSCFSLARPGEPNKIAPVYFPSRAWLTSVNLTEYVTPGGEVSKQGYTLYFQACRELNAYFTHLSSVPEKFSGLIQRDRCTSYETNGQRVNLCQTSVFLEVQAGELAGLSGDAAIVDFGLTDSRMEPLGFARPDHYMREMLFYTSPVPYFTAEPRAVLESKLRSYDGERARVSEPRIGEYNQDLPGTAQGNWFTPSANLATPFQQPDPFLALVHDYIDPSQPVFSVGNSVKGLRPGVYWFSPEPEGLRNRDFGAITADGKTYCFDNFGPRGVRQTTAGGIPAGQPDGVLLVAMPDSESLLLELEPAASCAAMAEWKFTGAAARFER